MPPRLLVLGYVPFSVSPTQGCVGKLNDLIEEGVLAVITHTIVVLPPQIENLPSTLVPERGTVGSGWVVCI